MSAEAIILIVDDEPWGREALGALLKSHGYTLLFAANGLEALELARLMERASELLQAHISLGLAAQALDSGAVREHINAIRELAGGSVAHWARERAKCLLEQVG